MMATNWQEYPDKKPEWTSAGGSLVWPDGRECEDGEEQACIEAWREEK